ncbi:hypothetical protein N8573_00395 [bacterium]|nr:hypothetical protein [bacterium]MDB4272015.1 hypothetical protein [bacterium]MDB4272028.1 hypothetical protein [bacterium]MDB4313434.1 hypothetical protein [bacterium]MDB4313445.1 hypothetical protein [bacterium]
MLLDEAEDGFGVLAGVVEANEGKGILVAEDLEIFKNLGITGVLGAIAPVWMLALTVAGVTDRLMGSGEEVGFFLLKNILSRNAGGKEERQGEKEALNHVWATIQALIAYPRQAAIA